MNRLAALFRIWTPPQRLGHRQATNEAKRVAICSGIDAHGFDWQIWAVSSSGFVTDSYNLFATNVILPMLAFVYWRGDPLDDAVSRENAINLVTLSGSVTGMLLFGFLADKLGRKKLYGVELVIVIFGTLGIVQCGAGYNQQSMDILTWMLFWRFLVGIGIGAEYPLSAVITAEFAARKSRARMMASVFIMQPLGQVAAAAVGLAVLLTTGSGLSSLVDSDATVMVDRGSEAAAVTVDRIWRVVIGVGAIPAFIAIYFRLTIPESPRWTLNVDHDGTRALQDTEKYLKLQQALQRNQRLVEEAKNDDIEGGVVTADSEPLQEPEQAALAGGDAASSDIQSIHDEDSPDGKEGDDDARPPDPFSWPEFKRFFYTEGNIKYLLGTSMTWFLLDFAFYGLGINNPRVLAEIWAYNPIRTNASATQSWGNPSDLDLYDAGQLGKSIYGILYWNGVRSITTTCIGSLIGSLIIVKLINYVPRKAWLTWSFICIAVLFAIAGGSFVAVAYTHLHALTIAFYVLAQLLFNLGPNTLTFIIPAEIFPTRYRDTCHGISAAAGKLGSIIVQAFLQRTHVSEANSKTLAWVLIGFSFAMGLGAVFAWAWLPEVQHARGWVPNGDAQGGVGTGAETTRRKGLGRYVIESKSLEELAAGWRRNVEPVDEALQVGFRLRGRRLAARVRGAVQRPRGVG